MRVNHPMNEIFERLEHIKVTKEDFLREKKLELAKLRYLIDLYCRRYDT